MSQEYSSDFIELAQIGYLTEDVNFCGHVFTLKTLNTLEELIVAKIVNEYKGTIGELKATYAAFVAASLSRVNDVPFYPNVTDETLENHLRNRFLQITQWSYLVIEHLAETCLTLIERSREAVDFLDKRSSQTN